MSQIAALLKSESASNPLAGYKVRTWQRLEAIYGSYENYRKKFIAAADKLVTERWVVPSDGEKIKKEIDRRK